MPSSNILAQLLPALNKSNQLPSSNILSQLLPSSDVVNQLLPSATKLNTTIRLPPSVPTSAAVTDNTKVNILSALEKKLKSTSQADNMNVGVSSMKAATGVHQLNSQVASSVLHSANVAQPSPALSSSSAKSQSSSQRNKKVTRRSLASSSPHSVSNDIAPSNYNIPVEFSLEKAVFTQESIPRYQCSKEKPIEVCVIEVVSPWLMWLQPATVEFDTVCKKMRLVFEYLL